MMGFSRGWRGALLLLEAGGDLDKAVTMFTEEGGHVYIPKRPTDA